MTYYRYELFGSDESITISVRKFEQIKKTPLGCWIKEEYSTRKHFILESSKKKYAYSTLEKARNAFIFRTKYELIFVERRFKTLNAVLLLRSDDIELDEKEQYFDLAGKKLDNTW